MGAYCFINFDCLLDSLGGLTIGDRVSLAPGVSLITTSHAIGGPEMRCGEIYWAPIIIGDGVWIGANATVLPGISVGPGAVIAAGAVVTADIEPNGLYAGVPARRTAELNNTESADLGTI
jgi:acetyltransferase-like isoleucine patch superfamily enzyme